MGAAISIILLFACIGGLGAIAYFGLGSVYDFVAVSIQPKCKTNADCIPKIDPNVGSCDYSKNGNTECTSMGFPFCHPDWKKCVSRAPNQSTSLVCDTTTGKCAGCLKDSDCTPSYDPSGATCTGFVPNECKDPNYPVCNGIVKKCQSNANFKPEYNKCDSTTSTCSACTKDDDCSATPNTPYCGKTMDTSLPYDGPPYQQPRVCVACKTDNNCPNSFKCAPTSADPAILAQYKNKIDDIPLTINYYLPPRCVECTEDIDCKNSSVGPKCVKNVCTVECNQDSDCSNSKDGTHCDKGKCTATVTTTSVTTTTS